RIWRQTQPTSPSDRDRARLKRRARVGQGSGRAGDYRGRAGLANAEVVTARAAAVVGVTREGVAGRRGADVGVARVVRIWRQTQPTNPSDRDRARLKRRARVGQGSGRAGDHRRRAGLANAEVVTARAAAVVGVTREGVAGRRGADVGVARVVRIWRQTQPT